MNDVPELRQLRNDALGWLVNVHDTAACGWGWLPHIPPNEQNTAEAVVALIKHAEDLDQHTPLIIRCVERQLLASEASVTKDWIWVAYALLTVKNAGLYPAHAGLDDAIRTTMDEVERLREPAEGGWPDSPGEPCQVTWTALALILLHDHLQPNTIAGASRFLTRAQNSDHGWGLWNITADEVERLFQNHPRLIARASSQVASNAACTALATLALSTVNSSPGRVAGGVKWLLSNTLPTGGWPVFQQIGVRLGATYTYRHFSTTWAIRALLNVDKNLLYDETVIAAVMYLIRLHDIATNGWRSGDDADPSTWATCNALDALDDVTNCLLIRTPSMFNVISQWHKTRHLRDVATVESLGTQFVFNPATSLAGSVMVTVLVAWGIALLAATPKPFQLAGAGVLTAIAGIPWVFHLKGHHHGKWSEAIAFVYTIVGVIIGVLLAIGSVTNI